MKPQLPKERKLDLEEDFQEYMLVSYPRVKKSDAQYVESKRMFFAGVSAIFFHLILDLKDASLDEAEQRMIDLEKQIRSFWEKESFL